MNSFLLCTLAQDLPWCQLWLQSTALKNCTMYVHRYHLHKCREYHSSALQAVINNTVQKQGQGLYVLLQDKCQRQAARLITLAASVTSDPRTFLATLQSLWNDYTSQTALLRAVFSYIDSSMASFSSGAVVSVTDMCLHAFADALVASTGAVHGVLQRTVVAVRDIVCAERDGDNVDRSMIAAIVRMLSSLGTSNRSSGLYSSHLEPVLLENCETYYAHEAAARLASLDTAQYLAHVDTRLRQEVCSTICAAVSSPVRAHSHCLSPNPCSKSAVTAAYFLRHGGLYNLCCPRF